MFLLKQPPVYVTPEMHAVQAAAMKAVAEHPKRPASYHIVTYGCQMNAHDSEKLSGMLAGMGMTEADDRLHADLVIFNENEKWKVDGFVSKSSNSPFTGEELYGRVKYTICNGKVVYEDK
jgi:dihydroorotase